LVVRHELHTPFPMSVASDTATARLAWRRIGSTRAAANRNKSNAGIGAILRSWSWAQHRNSRACLGGKTARADADQSFGTNPQSCALNRPCGEFAVRRAYC